jgi:hypothetical protein
MSRASGFGFRASARENGLAKVAPGCYDFDSPEAQWLKPEARLILAPIRRKSRESTLAVAKL